VTNRRIILGTVLLNALGYGLLIPVLPDVVRRFDADPSFVSRYFGYFIAIYAVVQFAAAPVLGSLSDRYGRRPVLLASLAGGAVDYLLLPGGMATGRSSRSATRNTASASNHDNLCRSPVRSDQFEPILIIE